MKRNMVQLLLFVVVAVALFWFLFTSDVTRTAVALHLK